MKGWSRPASLATLRKPPADGEPTVRRASRAAPGTLLPQAAIDAAERAYQAWCKATGKTPTPRPTLPTAPPGGRPLGGREDGRRGETNPDWAFVDDRWVHAPLAAAVAVAATDTPTEHPFTDAEKAYWATDEAKASAARWQRIAEEEALVAQALAEIAAEDDASAAGDAQRPRDAIDDYAATLDPEQAAVDLDATVDAYVAAHAPGLAEQTAHEERTHAQERAEIDASWAQIEQNIGRKDQP